MHKMMSELWILLTCLTLAIAVSDVIPQEFLSGNNRFSAAVYKEVAKEVPGNIIASPFSIEILLALAQSNLASETGAEIRKTLSLPDRQEDISSTFKSLLPTIKSAKNYTFNTANKIYIKNNVQLRNEFRTTASEIYDSEIENVDFQSKDRAAGIINEWVEKRTENKIQNLIDPLTLSPDTVAILINAIHFKALWKEQFKLFNTLRVNFYKNRNEVIQVDTMSRKGPYNYYESSELKAKFLEVPFKHEEASMVFVLPNSYKDGLGDLENQIDEILANHNFTHEIVRVSLPKFKFEYKINLKKHLQNLGINKAFSDKEADFDNIVGNNEKVFISEVIQKAFIDVNEAGVEAAVATSPGFVPISGPLHFPNAKIFNADHPFIFYIKIKNVIAFIGRVISPL